MRFTPQKVTEYFWKVLPFTKVTITYVFFSILFGYMIGGILLLMHYSKFRILNAISRAYLMIFRCVPSIVMILLIYYGVPALLEEQGFTVPEFPIIVYVIITFSLSIGAFSSEIMRSAYEAVSRGQYEAAVACGLTPLQAFRRILLPQIIPIAIPNIGNEIIFLIKTGSLAYLIGLRDIYGGALYYADLDRKVYVLETFVSMTLIYWPISVILNRIFFGLEQLFSVDRRIERSARRREAAV